MNLLKVLGLHDKKGSQKELWLYLHKCDTLFYEGGLCYILDKKQKMSILLLLRMFYNVTNYKKDSLRHYIYTFYEDLYGVSPEDLSTEATINSTYYSLISVLQNLPERTKIGIVLVFNCMLRIDKNATEEEIKQFNALINLIGINGNLYKETIKAYKKTNKFMRIKHIYDMS